MMDKIRRALLRPQGYLITGITLLVIAALVVVLVINTTTDEDTAKPETPKLSHSSAAYQWGTQFIKKPRASGWKTTSHSFGFLSHKCVKDMSPPQSVLHTFSGTGKGTSLHVQIVAPGVSTSLLHHYGTKLSNCSHKAESVHDLDNGGKVIEFGDTFLIALGDVVVAGRSKDHRDLSATIIKDMEESLQPACHSLDVAQSDKLRNKTIANKKYTGLLKHEQVESTIDTQTRATFDTPDLRTIKDTDISEPDGPLSSSVPSKPTKVKKPSGVSIPNVNETYSDKATYRVQDKEGPGCGWDWTNWNHNFPSNDAFMQYKNKGLKQAQHRANVKAAKMINKRNRALVQSMSLLADINEWNEYVDDTNAAHKKWKWLNEQRADVKDEWKKYVKDHDYWLHFDEKQSKAQEQYNEDEEKCREQEKKLDGWKSRYDTSESSGDQDKNIPKKPQGCSTEPTEPKIINKERPKEPVKPDLPTGVTIPDSWEHPDK